MSSVPDRVKNHAVLLISSSTYHICVILVIWMGGATATPLSAQEAAEFFRQNCISCHTIGGGRLTGPDLKDVTQRQKRDWLVRFIMDPRAMIDSGDAYALQLKREARDVVMANVAGMTKQRAEALLDLIEVESKLPKSQFAGFAISMEPFTVDDVARGQALFTGQRALEEGGPACISCHSVRGTGLLGGGRLGPDLSLVYERLEGRKNLSAWLFAPATATMQPLFRGRSLKPEEIHALVAYFESSAKQGGVADWSGNLAFLLLGMGGAAGGLAAMDAVWRGRFRAVRRPLVETQSRRET